MSISNWNPMDGGPSQKHLATVDLDCFHCHGKTRVVVKVLAHEEARYWQKRCEELQKQRELAWGIAERESSNPEIQRFIFGRLWVARLEELKAIVSGEERADGR